MFNKNTHSSYTLAWVQDKGNSPIIIYDDQLGFDTDNKLSRVVKPSKKIKAKGMKHYFVHFDSLAPNTIYHFAIQSSEGISEKYWFKTLPLNPSKLSFIAGGDSRTNLNIRRLANIMVAKLQPDFVVFNGDFTYSSTAKQWAEWLNDWQLTIANGRIIPIVTVMGNHERATDLPKVFDTPNVYSLSFGNLLHIAILNTNDKNNFETQAHFLEDELSNTQAIFKMVAFHKPMRPHYSKKSEGDDIYDAWADIIYQEKVQIVFEGDTHISSITYPIRPSNSPDADEGFIRDDANGTIYTGEGTWGAPIREADDWKDWTMDAAAVNQIKWIFVDSSKMEIRTIIYDNVANVEQLTYDNRFQIPQNLNLWKPARNEVVIIER